MSSRHYSEMSTYIRLQAVRRRELLSTPLLLAMIFEPSLTSKPLRTLTSERVNRVYGPEQHCGRTDKTRRVAELENRQTLLEVEARLTYTQVIVERQNL